MTADTSVVIAALSDWHKAHDAARAAIDSIRQLPAHAIVEAYASLTRLPAGFAIPAPEAAESLRAWFPDAPLALSAAQRLDLPARLARAGIAGGATYDALVAMEAAVHDEPLLTLDRRAMRATYPLLGVEVWPL